MPRAVCPHCKREFSFRENRYGQIVSCPACRGRMQMPDAPEPPRRAEPPPPVEPHSPPPTRPVYIDRHDPPGGDASGCWFAVGIILLVLGLASAGFFFLIFDTTVATAPEAIGIRIGRVHNLGLMQTQRNGLAVSLFVAGAGLFLVVMTQRPRR